MLPKVLHQLLYVVYTFLFLHTTVSVICECISPGSHHVDSTTRFNDLTRQLHDVLQIDGVKNKDKVASSENESWSILPPKYMIDLYHKYTDDKFKWYTHPSQTTTVRCILGKVRRESVHFNVSSLMDNYSKNSISHAEIHVFRRTRRSKLSFAQHRIRLRNLPKKVLATIISLAPSRGWQAVDITNTVKTSLGKGKFLSMTVEASIPEFGTGRERYHTVPVDEVLRVAYRPFLVIFSKSPTNLSSKETKFTTSPNSLLTFPNSRTMKDDGDIDDDDDDVEDYEDEDDDFDDNDDEIYAMEEEDEEKKKPKKKKEYKKQSAKFYNSYKNKNNDYSGSSISSSKKKQKKKNNNFNQIERVNSNELENSLQSVLNTDSLPTLEQHKKNQYYYSTDGNKGFGMENNEISESAIHFRYYTPSPTSQGRMPSINHSHSMNKRSIEDNEFLDTVDVTGSKLQEPPSSLRVDYRLNENSINDADDQNNALLSNDIDGQFLSNQDNFDNGLKVVSTPSLSSYYSTTSQSSVDSNPNPILPLPNHRWWKYHSQDQAWNSPSSSSSFKNKSGGRRRGKMERKGKVRRNRQGKKYWKIERKSSRSSSSMDAKSKTRDSPLQRKVEESSFISATTTTRTTPTTTTTVNTMSSCRLVELSVDKANLDWAERIIAPAIFPLNYCEGSCSSVANSMDGGEDTRDDSLLDFNNILDLDYPSSMNPSSSTSSSQCCTPTTKKRLVILYSDIHDNIILQIQPNVTVQGCVCH